MQHVISQTSAEFVEKQGLLRRKVTWIGGLLVALGLGIGAFYFVQMRRQETPLPTSVQTEKNQAIAITSLGRLEPEGEVIKLSVSNAQDSRVNQLRVKEGDWVKAGQVIAILQGLDKKKAELEEAQRNVDIFQAKLTQIMAGEAKLADITAQQANIKRLEAQLATETSERKASIARARAELRTAELHYRRYRTLHQKGAVTTATLDDRQEAFEMAQAEVDRAEAQLSNTASTLKAQILQEQALLKKLKEVRPVDRQEAQAELDFAIASVNRIKAELDDLYVRVPVAGQILKINTRVGEQVNTSEGIVELGRTNQMYAIAEVYETDVGLIKVGQLATVVSEHGGFSGRIQGQVDHIGLQIKKQDILDSDPAAARDARVVEVKVRIDQNDNAKVSGLTNLQVRITIDATEANR